MTAGIETRLAEPDWRRLGVPAAAYTAVCLLLWPIPVFGLLHAESSAVIAGVGFFVAGLDGVRQFRRGADLRRVVGEHVALLLVPLALLTLSLLWRPNCGYGQGLLIFGLLVPPSVLLGVALAFALVGMGARWPALTLGLVGIGVAVGGVLADLLLHPQLFTYSHIFGGVLGPIYDDELAVRPGLAAAKAQTLLWATLLLCVGRRARNGGSGWTMAGAGAAIALGLSYLFSVPLGIQQSAANLQRTLDLRIDLGPLVLHLDGNETAPAEAAWLADEALYRYENLTERLGTAPSGPIDVYLYPDADVKAALIGSRRTSVTPVWLPTPQVHMLADEVPASLAHEFVHVFAREFGMPIIGASPAVGLVEGLAVALEPPSGLPDATSLVVAGRALPSNAGGLNADPAEAVARVMSPGGFWTSRAGVAYTASGAFVAWLLDRYGPEPFHEAYRTGRFEPAYGESLAALASTWERDLAARPIDPEAVAVAAWLFRRPSLFEVRCPHYVPAPVRLTRAGGEALEDGRPGEALPQFDAALALDLYAVGAQEGRVRALVQTGGDLTDADLQRARLLADSLGDARSLRLLGDVHSLRGEWRIASEAYEAVADSLLPVDAVGRLLGRRRRALDPEAIRAMLAAPPGEVPPAVETRAPIHAALHWLRADRPDEAWRVARAWCAGDLLAGFGAEARAEGRRAITLLQAQIAYRAGAVTTAERRAEAAGQAFATRGPRSLAPYAADLARRARWRARREARATVETGSILSAPHAVPDALSPLCRPVDRRPRAPDAGLRAPGRGV